ncbi:transglutaminase family protein [Falsiroseomonas sp. E2-1-a4]|uniref:transglutaminase family protein n=1 Tax=Falsiroseomonas sp. E2-1-a4 TaxID=3239299 RepID=UPI003F36531D
MTRYTLWHRTAYRYGRSVDLASHLLHLSPRKLPGQVVRAAEIAVLPEGGHRKDGQDHFGNGVTWLFIGTTHDAFEVTLKATVEVDFAPPPPAEDTLPWEQVRDAARSPEGWDAAEFTLPSHHAPAERAAGAYAVESFPPGRPIMAGVRELCARIRRDFAFKAGVTSISTPVSRVLELRAGVCQDFAHLMIAGLRALGLPARYCSGYVRTRPPPGQKRRQGADQSHAWVGCWLGPRHGWVDLDPTNDLVVSDEHLLLGWGRDFSDVSPVTGILLGGGRQKLTVGVDLIAE